MAKSAALLILRTGEPSREDSNALEAAAFGVLEDIRLAERVVRALRATGHGPLRDIGVTVHARTVSLEGQVPSYFLKQLAQATASAVPGAHRVCNDLEVGLLS
jgi:osmotically-inducible protein OsmY